MKPMKRFAFAAGLVVMNLAVASGVHLLWSQGTSVDAAVKPVAPVPVLTDEERVVAAIARVSPAVVSILVQKEEIETINIIIDADGVIMREGGGEKKLVDVGRGTGFLVSKDGLIVTNRHVAGDRAAVFTVFLSDEREFKARLIDVDPVNDLALIKIEGTALPVAELETNDSPKIGSTVVAIGNALGKYANTVTRGILSGINRSLDAQNEATGEIEFLEDVLQTDAAINSGNSGGPLVNLSGKVIGVNTALESGAQSLGFAIPASEVRKVLSSYARFASIARPRLGVRTIAITPDVAVSEKLEVKNGALVTGDEGLPAVVPNSPAAAAGIREGDIITDVNGIIVQGKRTLSKIIQDMNVGDRVTLKVLRGKDIIILNASLDAHPPYGS